MKHLCFLFAAFLLAACSKDEFDPSKPQNGQEVELFIDHYTSASDSRIFSNTNREEPLYTYIDHFLDRELGYTYIIKAKTVVAPEGLMDGPSYWFDHIQTIRKDKYQGQDTLILPLFGWVAPSNTLYLREEAGKFYYGQYTLRPADDAVTAALEEGLKEGQEIMTAYRPNSMALHVRHDEENYGKGYVVYRVEL
jgi:hypothetical protein